MRMMRLDPDSCLAINCTAARWNMSPEPLAESKFARQYRTVGTVESICTRCFLVVGRACSAADLANLESRHVCQLLERRQMIRIAGQEVDPIDQRRSME